MVRQAMSDAVEECYADGRASPTWCGAVSSRRASADDQLAAREANLMPWIARTNGATSGEARSCASVT